MENILFYICISFLTYIEFAHVHGSVSRDLCVTRYKELLDSIPNSASAAERCEYMSPVFTCQLSITDDGQPTEKDIGVVKVQARGQCNDTIDAIVEANEVNQDFQKMTFNREVSLKCLEYLNENVNDTLSDDVKCEILKNFSKCIIKTYGSSRPEADVVKRVSEVLSDAGADSPSTCAIDPDILMDEVWGRNHAVTVTSSFWVTVTLLPVITFMMSY
ncbi:hypothetical protein Bpfe_002925 [Biomphalaria pfeifferi]|uniref:Uncharacterized protein n=1 Tax=Biomphalaria pfeifferi TaxID=112525 RepID=A0AAD8C829_BIOPF|nr:hypothetical protein Bpfe_002925 [Biomphalaria pfeifferi]